MKVYGFGLALVIALCVLALPMPALASVGVADPGFSYVDVDNDGLYDPSTDIGLLSTPPVDIDAIIVASGHFDTSQSQGAYHAPPCPASLVISRTREPALLVPICLKAGVDLIDYGRLSTPQSISLQACRDLYMATSQSSFGTQMTISAGRDINMDGAIIAGDENSPSKLYVSACGNISAQQFVDTSTSIVTATNIAVGSVVNFCANGCIYFDGASIATSQNGTSVSLVAGGAMQAEDQTSIATNGEADITAQSQCSLVDLVNDNIDGNTLQVCANSGADVSSSIITTTGATTIQANGPVDGTTVSSIPTIISCSCFTVNSCDSVDLSTSNIFADPGAISVTGNSDVTANSVQWTAGSEIEVTSYCGDIYARTSQMEVTSVPPGPIEFYAGGGLIDVTGSVFVGTVTYKPNGVVVIGVP
jgi:hypothetical protein